MLKWMAAAAVMAGLAGCDVPLLVAAEVNDAEGVGLTHVEFPARMVVVPEGRPEQVYGGTLRGYVNGAAVLEVTAETGETCAGRFEPDGAGLVTCGARVMRFASEGKPKQAFSGAEYRAAVVDGVSVRSAFGWGRGADMGVVRRALAERRSLSAGEVRAMTRG